MRHKPALNPVPETRPSLDVVGPEMDALRQFQAASIGALDTKAGIILGFSGTILTIFVGGKADKGLLFLWGVALLAISVVLAIAALIVRGFYFNPKPKVLLDDYMMRHPDAAAVPTGAKEQILSDKVSAYEKNEKTLTEKASFVRWAIICLGAGVILGAIDALWRNL